MLLVLAITMSALANAMLSVSLLHHGAARRPHAISLAITSAGLFCTAFALALA